jgi:hypothetical protein
LIYYYFKKKHKERERERDGQDKKGRKKKSFFSRTILIFTILNSDLFLNETINNYLVVVSIAFVSMNVQSLIPHHFTSIEAIPSHSLGFN